jgi:hypothetical protein
MSVVRLSVERGQATPVDAGNGLQEAVEAARRGEWLQQSAQGRVASLRSVQRARYVTRLTVQRWMN